MPLLAYNLTGSSKTLAAGSPLVTLPASPAPPYRSAPTKVTSELRGLTATDYRNLQEQVSNGEVEYEWSEVALYDTGDLEVLGPANTRHAEDHLSRGNDPLAIAPAAGVNLSVAVRNQTTVACLMDEVDAPAAASTTAVHAAFAANDASNDFPGPFTDPDVPRNLTVTFQAGWDGGDVTVVGTDQFGAAVTEVFTSTPGSTVVGAKIFASVTSATKGQVGATTNTASIGTGDKLGILGVVESDFGMLSVDGASEAVTVDSTYAGFTPTSLPNGSRVYVVMVPSAHTHQQDTHTHIQRPHPHQLSLPQ